MAGNLQVVDRLDLGYIHRVVVSNSLNNFQFETQPRAAEWIAGHIDEVVRSVPAAADLARRLRDETGTRFIDWVERLTLPDSPTLQEELRELGFTSDSGVGSLPAGLYDHPGGMFPVVELGEQFGLSLLADSVEDFARQVQCEGRPMGEPFSPTRRVLVAEGHTAGLDTARLDPARLWVTERHCGRFVSEFTQAEPELVQSTLECFVRRPRELNEIDAFREAKRLIADATAKLGAEYCCDLFFKAERIYWESRNDAARWQKSRQDALGLGWGNHDHHTYRSSREHFKELIECMELLGLRCRERFYAGREAGWGAQVLEHPANGILVFADVDLAPEEIMGDFAHDGLEPHDQLGTVGLWCKLHGEAFLSAGMHHLEAQFDFLEACRQIDPVFGVMPPFSDFPYLKQCFTRGQQWDVSDERLQKGLRNGWITDDQAERFRREGALGSHLEILERNDGYKGFNQGGISKIIARTDPRGQAAE